MTAEEFVRRLDDENQKLLGRLAPDDTLRPEVTGDLSVVNLLKVALKNEIEATEIAARWLVTTDDVEVKLALARQVGDEAKHYRLIADRLKALGFAPTTFNPLAKGYGPLFTYLDGLPSTVERIAAGQFTREAIAIVKNRQFITFCEHAEDRETALTWINENMTPQQETFENVRALVPFFEMLFQSARNKTPVHVLHYGDSHTASDDFPNTLREQFQSRFGNGGPGFSLAVWLPRMEYG